MLFSLLLIPIAAIVEWARGDGYKLPAACILGITFAGSSFLSGIPLIQCILSIPVVTGGFYATAITSPRPLFGCLHGVVNPYEWKYNKFNKWMYDLTEDIVGYQNGRDFGMVFGAFRGLYCLVISVGLGIVFLTPWIVPLGLLGSYQGLCYFAAGKILPNNKFNAALARIFFGCVIGIILSLSLLIKMEYY